MTDPRDEDTPPPPDPATPPATEATGDGADAEAGAAASAVAPKQAGGDRIAKVMSRAGVASRREAERMIVEGRVTVNGRVIDSPALDVTPADRIAVDGKPVEAPQETRLWLYYKPVGLVTTDSDELGRQTIQDALPRDLPRVMTVGRLDLNSEGLLLLTNDGTLKRVLELPSTGWLRRYRVRVNGTPNDLTLAPLKRGITIEGEEFAPMEVTIDSSRGANSWLTVGIREGRNREIRRAMAHVGLTVNRLIRIGYGPFKLAEMEKNEVREVKRRVLREQLGGLMPGAEKTEEAAAESPRKPRPPRHAGGARADAPRAGASRADGPRAARGPGGASHFRREDRGDASRDAEGGPRSRPGGGAPRPARGPRAEADARPARPVRTDGGDTRGGFEKRAPRDDGAADRPARPFRARDGASGDRSPAGPRADGEARGGYKRNPREAGAAERPVRTPRPTGDTGPERPARKARADDAAPAAGAKGAYRKRDEGGAPRKSPPAAGKARGDASWSRRGEGGPTSDRGASKGRTGDQPRPERGGYGGGRAGGPGKPRPPAGGGAGSPPRAPSGKSPRGR